RYARAVVDQARPAPAGPATPCRASRGVDRELPGRRIGVRTRRPVRHRTANGQQHPPPARRADAPPRPLPRPGQRRHPPLQPRLVPGTSRRPLGRQPHHRAEQTARTRHPHPRHPRASARRSRWSSMTRRPATLSARSGSNSATVVHAVTVIMGVVVGLTFLFGFGNVLNLALRLGVPVWVAPLVAPAVDLSILGLLLGTRHLALAGASVEVLRPARRLLIFASVVTLALNVADPVVAGEYGKAAFDAVGPLLL